MTKKQYMVFNPQEDVPVSRENQGSYVIRYSYSRSTETLSSGEPNQDYLVLREDNDLLVFALCDGVSQSFFGDLAASMLGDALVGVFCCFQRVQPAEAAKSLLGIS